MRYEDVEEGSALGKGTGAPDVEPAEHIAHRDHHTEVHIGSTSKMDPGIPKQTGGLLSLGDSATWMGVAAKHSKIVSVVAVFVVFVAAWRGQVGHNLGD